MSEFMKLAIVFISMLVLFYFLWVNGYMILNAKRALLFVVSLRGKNKCEVSFSSCSGYVKKVIKFKTKQHILLSICHMLCNRLTGKRNLEAKYLQLIRIAIRTLKKREEFFNKL